MSVPRWEPKRWEPATEYTGAGEYAPSMQEDALGQWVDVDDARLAIEVRDRRIAALEAEVERLHKLFDDAGQGEHNVLALVEHYQAEAIRADERADALMAVVGEMEADACACCGVLLEAKPLLCEDCAPTFTTYADGASCCERHNAANHKEIEG